MATICCLNLAALDNSSSSLANRIPPPSLSHWPPADSIATASAAASCNWGEVEDFNWGEDEAFGDVCGDAFKEFDVDVDDEEDDDEEDIVVEETLSDVSDSFLSMSFGLSLLFAVGSCSISLGFGSPVVSTGRSSGSGS